jgi:hypothetical protein
MAIMLNASPKLPYRPRGSKFGGFMAPLVKVNENMMLLFNKQTKVVPVPACPSNINDDDNHIIKSVSNSRTPETFHAHSHAGRARCEAILLKLAITALYFETFYAHGHS